MKRVVIILVILLAAVGAFADSFWMFGLDSGLAGNAGANIVGGGEIANDLFLGGGLDFLAAFPVASSPQSFMVSLGLQYFSHGKSDAWGLLFGADIGFADFVVASNPNDDWCYAMDSWIGYDLGGIALALKANIYFISNPQATLTLLVNVGGLELSQNETKTVNQERSQPVEDYNKEINDYRKPLAPLLTDFSFIETSSSITVTWMGFGDDLVYHLYRDGTLLYSGSLTYYVDNGLPPNTTYHYYMTASNEYGTSPVSTTAIDKTLDVLKPKVVQQLQEPTVGSIQAAATWVNRHITYDQDKADHDDHILLSPSQVLKSRSGVCRDMVVLTMHIVHAALERKPYFVALEIPGSKVGHAILGFNDGANVLLFDPTDLLSYAMSEDKTHALLKVNGQQIPLRITAVYSYDEIMDGIGKQLKD